MNKKMGYLLLLAGLGLMVASAVMLWRMVYGTMLPPQALGSENNITFAMASGMTVNIPMPPQVNRLGNLSLGVMLMFFLALVGGKVGALGVNLINGPSVTPPPKPQ
jgi:hypothetical protein